MKPLLTLPLVQPRISPARAHMALKAETPPRPKRMKLSNTVVIPGVLSPWGEAFASMKPFVQKVYDIGSSRHKRRNISARNPPIIHSPATWHHHKDMFRVPHFVVAAVVLSTRASAPNREINSFARQGSNVIPKQRNKKRSALQVVCVIGPMQ